jgi:hypothetical protein
MLPAKFLEEQLGGVNVPVDRLGRLLGNESHTDRSGQMIHRIHSAACLAHAVSIPHVSFDQDQVRVGGNSLEIPTRPGAEIVDDHDLVPLAQEPFGQMRTYKTTTARNEKTHAARKNKIGDAKKGLASNPPILLESHWVAPWVRRQPAAQMINFATFSSYAVKGC